MGAMRFLISYVIDILHTKKKYSNVASTEVDLEIIFKVKDWWG